MRFETRSTTCALTILLLAVGAAGDPPPTSQPADGPGATSRPAPAPAPPAASRGLLAGPSVEPEAIGSAGERQARRARRARPAVPAQRWFEIVRGLDLTPEQKRGMRTVVEALGRERRAFQRKHGAELRRLRRQVREAAAEGTQPTEAITAKLRALRAKQPKVEVEEAIRDLLTPDQQEQMHEAIERVRAEIDAERRQRRKPGDKMDETSRRRLEFLRSRVVR